MGSAGGVLCDNNGSWSWGFAVNIGKANSFTVELWGLREGVRLLRELGVSKVVVELDSKAAVDLLAKPRRENADEDILVADCRYLSSMINHIKYTHVLREGNACADYLANLGQNLQWDTAFLEDPPEGILGLLEVDTGGIGTRRIR